MTQQMFPIMPADRRYPGRAAPRRIPWPVAEKAYMAYAARYGTDQSMERMAERGGFGVEEMDELYPAWREESDSLVRTAHALQAALDALDAIYGRGGTAGHNEGAVFNNWLAAHPEAMEQARGYDNAFQAAARWTASSIRKWMGIEL